MTSEDTPDTTCIKCPVSGCPVGSAPNAVRAYRSGCRSQSARDAWAEHMRDYRAGNPSDSSNAGSARSSGITADAWPVPSVKREPYGQDCPVKDCGSPLHWEPGYAGIMCGKGHWFNDPRIAKRIPVKTRAVAAAKPVDTVAEMKARSQFRLQRQRLIAECDELINGDFNPDNYPKGGNYYRGYAAQMQQQLLAMRPEFTAADTPQMLDAGRQMLTDFLSYVQSNLAGLKTAREIEYGKRQQQALEESEDDEYEETEDYEDSDESYQEPEQSVSRGSQSHDYLPAQSQIQLSGAILRAGLLVKQAQEKRERNGTCFFTANHKGFLSRVPTATRHVYGYKHDRYVNVPSKPIAICGSDQCRAKAEAYMLRNNWEFTVEKELP